MILTASFARTCEFFVVQTLACLLFMLPLKKRGRGIWPVVGATVLALVMRVAYTLLSGFSIMGTQAPLALWFGHVLVAYISMFLNIFLACDIGVSDALYCLVWADLTQNFLMALFRCGTSLYESFFGEWNDAGGVSLLTFALMLAVMVPIIYYVLARGLPTKGCYHATRLQACEALLIDVPAFFFVNLDIIFPLLGDNGQFQLRTALLRLIVDLCALSLLYLLFDQARRRNLEHSVQLLENTLGQQYQQYLLSRDTIDLINRKCHDLRHQITALETGGDSAERRTALAELRDSVRIYDTFCHTGNDVLDTVLTDKMLICESKGITLTCVADGAALAFLKPMDLCSIFGNALDNAIESVERLPKQEKRLIHVTVFAEKELVMLRFENYFEGELTMSDGLPTTTKEQNGYHGYGLKSIRYTAEHYGGTATVRSRDSWFELRVLLPQTE